MKFDEYMKKYQEIKQNSKGETRELAKLFLNIPYGKMTTPTHPSFNVEIKKDGVHIDEYDMLSLIRKYIILDNINYEEVNGSFIYADTDSIHLKWYRKV